MKNTIKFADVVIEGSAIKSISAAIDTSLNGRTLDVDTMQAVVQSGDESLTLVSQEYPVAFLRSGSQYSLHYLSSVAHIGEDFYLLNLTSPLGRLLQMPHRGGICAARTAGSLIREICGYVSGQPTAGITVYIAPAFENIPLYGWLPNVSPTGENGAKQGTAKDNLLQVLFAINATVRDDGQGTLRVENLSPAVSSILDEDRVFRGTTRIVHELPVTSVTVLEHQYIAGGELTTLFEGTTVAGQTIVFDAPMSELAATGFTIEESSANYAVLSAGSGTLTGRAYIHTTREITQAVTEGAVPNPVRIEGATLVSITNSGGIVRRLADYYSHRVWIECEASILFEDAGDVVSVWDTMSKTMREACIEKISPLRASNIMRGTISALIGFTPWQVTAFEDVRELLTGSGSWTVPDGVTEVTAVLIGGGSGGSFGNDGEDGLTPTISSSTRQLTGYTVYTKYIPMTGSYYGKGGRAGDPGKGGKVLRVTLSVTPGQTISYASGVGGAGQKYGSTEDAETGAETTFGALSSELGSSSDGGYVDPVTGEVYASEGAAGMDGKEGAGLNSDGTEHVPDPIIVDGLQYAAGERGETYPDGASGTNRVYYFFDGGFGGGPAFRANGNRGGKATFGISGWASVGYRTTATAAPGGDGADAQAPDAASGYGTGGTGGNGGGGAGAVGWKSQLSHEVWQSTSDGRGSDSLTAPVLGKGGKGSDGGEAASGCIILHYRKPVAA